MRVSSEIGVDASVSSPGAPGSSLALSPDGKLFAFVAETTSGRQAQLFVRRLAQLEAVPLPGTENARDPFFSPDGEWIAFFADGKLKKVSATGGAAVTLCDAPAGRGGTWAEDDTIAFVPDSTPDMSVFRVSSAGGRPEPLTTRAAGESLHRWPQTLRGGKAILFTAAASPGAFDSANIVVQTIPEGTRKIVHRGGYFGRYLPSGHLIYMSNGTVFAAPFDLDRLEMTGQQVPVLEGVQASTGTGGAQLAVSTSGTLVYLSGGELSIEATMSWLDRGGRTTPLRASASDWSNPSFSPDGRRVAFDVVGAGGGAPDVWVYEWSRDTPTKLTFDAGPDVKPVWTPDSRRIRVHLGPESLLATRRCLRRCPAPHRERKPSCCWLVAPERQVPGVLRAELQDRLRHPDPACGWRRNIRVEDWKAHGVPERPRVRTGADVFTRWPLAGVLLE